MYGVRAALRQPMVGPRGRRREVMGVLAGALAAIVAVVVAVTSAGTTSATTVGSNTVHFSAEQLNELADATTAQKEAVDHAIVTAFSRYGEAGTGTMPVPGQPVLAARDWSWGHTSTHIWVIMTFTDVHDGLLNGMKADCLAMLALEKMKGPFGYLCGTFVGLLAHYSNGYRPESNAGVWAALYWLPPGKITGGTW